MPAGITGRQVYRQEKKRPVKTGHFTDSLPTQETRKFVGKWSVNLPIGIADRYIYRLFTDNQNPNSRR